MIINYRSMKLAVVASLLSLSISATNASAFSPAKYFQNGATLSAIAAAVANLNGCDEDLKFSEKTAKDKDGQTIVLTITCNKWPEDDGKIGKAQTTVELELSEDGSVGLPLSFGYN